MPHAISAAAPGLQALILCGPGSSFPTFTANPDENPKALLPIANRPMVWYPIDFCYRSGITNITLICPASAAKATEAALNTNPFLTSLPSPRPDLLAPKDLDQTTPTAEILRLPEVREVVVSDFVVLPCDLVCALAGEKLLQAWMVKAASLPDTLGDWRSSDIPRSGGLAVYYDTRSETPVKGEETDFIAVTPLISDPMTVSKESLLGQIHELVYSIPTDSLKDITEEKSVFPIRHSLLRKHPKIRMMTSHRDAHIYIFPKWIMDFVAENSRLESIGEDVIGWWVKACWQPGLAEKLRLDAVLDPHASRETTAAARGETSQPDAGTEADARRTSVASPNMVTDGQTERHTQGSTASDTSKARRHGAVPQVLAYIHPSGPAEQLVRRVDTAQLLLATSLQLAKLPSIEEAGAEAASPFAHARKVAYPEGVKPRTTITKQDSLVADNVTVEEKVSIRESVVGANCQIREGAKLLQCLLMDGVVVGKNCKLTRCVLGRRSEVGEGSVLTECEVQENLLVEPRTQDAKNNLMSSAGLEASEAEMQEAMLDLDEEGLDHGWVEEAVVS